jgi:hypothetical protein
MNRFKKLVLVLCLALVTSTVSHATFAATLDEQIAARLDALEKENAALRARLNRIERQGEASKRAVPRAASLQNPPLASELETPGQAALMMDAHAQPASPPIIYKSQDGSSAPPRFELSGSLLFLQPGSGNLEYGTLVTPFPLATPNWSNRSRRTSALPSASALGICPTSPTIST